MALGGCSCWSSGGALCCTNSQVSLPVWNLRPWQGVRLSVSNCGSHYMVLFCSLMAFQTYWWGGDENGGTLNTNPGAESLCPHSSMALQRKTANHSCLPGFPPNLLVIQPVTECFYVRNGTLFWVSKLYSSCSVDLHHSSWGSWGWASLRAASPEGTSRTMRWLVVCGNMEKKADAWTHSF